MPTPSRLLAFVGLADERGRPSIGDAIVMMFRLGVRKSRLAQLVGDRVRSRLAGVSAKENRYPARAAMVEARQSAGPLAFEPWCPRYTKVKPKSAALHHADIRVCAWYDQPAEAAWKASGRLSFRAGAGPPSPPQGQTERHRLDQR